jgi:ELWxxDGT repeat protein
MAKEFPADQWISSSAVFSQSLIFTLISHPYITKTQELWRSDGSPAGTQPIKLLASAPMGVSLNWPASRFMRVGDRLAFDGPASCDPAADSYASLWTTDGSAAGTGLATPGLRLKDAAEPAISYETPMRPYEDRIVFFAKDDTHGVEPRISDGTTAGTRLLADLAPGAASSSPTDLAALPGKILVSAESPSSGHELWVLDAAAPAAPPPVPAASSYRLYLPLAAHSPALLCAAP